MDIKPFEDVAIGDIATDYGDHDYPVLGKGTMKEMFDKFGNRCAYGLSDFLEGNDDLGINKYTPAIAVQDTPQWDGDVSIYCYSTEGAYVKLNN